MIKRVALGFVVVGVASFAGFWLWLEDQKTAAWNVDFYEEAILAFEDSDRAAPPEPGAIVFVGSSSIRMWSRLEADMAPLRVLNRGFGGSHMSHVIRNVDRIVTNYRPSAVVVYEGDNDLSEGTGKTAEGVFEEWQRLVSRIHARAPEARIYFLSIKPSPRRWARWPEMLRANRMIERWNAGDERLGYVDVASPLLGADGMPREDFFLIDDLHMTDAGYAAWTKVVRPRLLADGAGAE